MGDDSSRDLHLPPGGEVRAAAVVVHPHPGMGGDRHHPLVVAIAAGLAEAGVAALRVDLRDPDVGASAARLEELAAGLLRELGVERLVLVGYSWGSVVTATVAQPAVVARVLVAPPIAMGAIPAPQPSVPTLALVPAHDQYGGPDAARSVMGTWSRTEIEVVEGADHFLVGAVARVAARATAWIDGLVPRQPEAPDTKQPRTRSQPES